MKFEEWLQDLKDSFDYIQTEEELLAFLKRIELTLIKGQVIGELPDIYIEKDEKYENREEKL